MKTLIVDNHTKHLQELRNSFPGAAVVSREDLDSVQPELFDLIVLSGGSRVPTVLNHNELYQEEEKLLALGKPVVGICLGCEIICRAFGGELELMSHTETGNKHFEILDESLKELLEAHDFVAYESHTVKIKQIPDDFYMIAQSDHGPEIIKHKTKPIIGIQFHPEIGVTQKLWSWLMEQEKLSLHTQML